jgi:hypothetical protein
MYFFGAIAIYVLPIVVMAQSSLGIQDPLSQQSVVCSLRGFIGGIYSIGTPIAAIVLVFAGFLFVKARGSPQALADAKKHLLWVLFSVGIFIGSWLLGVALVNTVRLVLPNTLQGLATC